MHHPDSLRQTVVGLMAAASLGSCGVASAVDPAATRPTASVDAQARIDALIGDAACDTQDQCRTIGIGAKPCGGPESWRAWSTRATDPRALQEAVQAHAEARKAENQRAGLASDCRVLPQPTAVCRPRASDGKRTCQLGQGGADSAI